MMQSQVQERAGLKEDFARSSIPVKLSIFPYEPNHRTYGCLITFRPSLPILWVSLVQLRLNMTESRVSSHAE
jgi:hypothetical protein